MKNSEKKLINGKIMNSKINVTQHIFNYILLTSLDNKIHSSLIWLGGNSRNLNNFSW